MIIELGLAYAGLFCAYRYVNKDSIIKKQDKKDFIHKWNLLMKCNGIKNKNDQTFEILKYIPRQKYGCDCIISIPIGLSYIDLEKLIPDIKSCFGCHVDLEWKQYDKCIYGRFAFSEIGDKEPFQITKTKPHQLILGINPFHQVVTTDMKENPHVLYTGINNSGKTYCLLSSLTGLVVNHTPREVEIYLAQISAKKDLRKFANVSHTKYYADTTDKALLMYQHLHKIMVRRNEIFNSVEDEYIDNIYDFNKRFPKRFMPIIYVCADEFSYYMSSEIDNKQEAELKDKCLDYLLSLIKEGRSVGIYLLVSLQRADMNSLPPSIKAQINTKVAFKQSNTASSLVVLDSEEAVRLKRREAILCMDDRQLIKTMYLPNSRIEELIVDKIDTNKTWINLDKKKKENVDKSKKIVEKVINIDKNNKKNNNEKSSTYKVKVR